MRKKDFVPTERLPTYRALLEWDGIDGPDSCRADAYRIDVTPLPEPPWFQLWTNGAPHNVWRIHPEDLFEEFPESRAVILERIRQQWEGYGRALKANLE